MKKYRVVNYACNGVGLGHVTRLLSINRSLRSILRQRQLNCEFYFLSTSDADQILTAECFPTFKLPSKRTIDKCGAEYEDFSTIARRFVWSSLDILQPDMLIVDTFPNGTFGEFSPATRRDTLLTCKHAVLVHRPVTLEAASKETFQRAIKQYESILVPEREGTATSFLAESLKPRTHYFGPVISCSESDALDKQTARKELGLPLDKTLVYISMGGGGNPLSEERLAFVCQSLKGVPDLHLVVAAGALYNASRIYGDSITWITVPGMSRYLKAFDIAISAAGYNTYHELLHLGTPTIFIPLPLAADDQYARADRAKDARAALTLTTLDATELRRLIAEISKPEVSSSLSKKAREFIPRNYAVDIAEHLAALLIEDGTAQQASDQPGIAF
jgi:UDP-N-acetylglucosamine--N-acetylmuramyl-(pentapeptide) pyrophosphoryl-undecaprenol N-acetylglucosamine transferase